MRAALTYPASKLSKTSRRLNAFVCYVLVIKRMKFETNLVFQFSSLLFMVSWIPIKTWMWTNSGYQLPSIFLKGEVWNFQMG